MKFLQGKKTYIGAAGLFLAAVLGWWFGAVNGTEATAMIAGAFSLVGLGARSTRYAELTLQALEEIKNSPRSHGDAESRKQLIKEAVAEVLPIASAIQLTNVPADLPSSIKLQVPAEKK